MKAKHGKRSINQMQKSTAPQQLAQKVAKKTVLRVRYRRYVFRAAVGYRHT